MSIKRELISKLILEKQYIFDDELREYENTLEGLSVAQLEELVEEERGFIYERDQQENNEIL